jgi:hypothetical protein
MEQSLEVEWRLMQNESGAGTEQRRGGNGRGDAVRLSAGSVFEGCEARRGKGHGWAFESLLFSNGGLGGLSRVGNMANLMVGSGVQQTRSRGSDEAVEVVRNHADGTQRVLADRLEGAAFGGVWNADDPR